MILSEGPAVRCTPATGPITSTIGDPGPPVEWGLIRGKRRALKRPPCPKEGPPPMLLPLFVIQWSHDAVCCWPCFGVGWPRNFVKEKFSHFFRKINFAGHIFNEFGEIRGGWIVAILGDFAFERFAKFHEIAFANLILRNKFSVRRNWAKNREFLWNFVFVYKVSSNIFVAALHFVWTPPYSGYILWSQANKMVFFSFSFSCRAWTRLSEVLLVTRVGSAQIQPNK